MSWENIYKSKSTEPLKPLEFEEYFEKFWQGDMEAREQLIIRNVRLVAKAMHRFSGVPFEKEDLHHIGLFALIKSVDTFDMTRNLKFSTYAMRCIYNEIYFYMRNNYNYLNMISLDDKLYEINNDDLNIEDNIEEQEIKQIIRKIVDSLPSKEQEIIKLYFGFINDTCYAQKQIANIIGISQAEVSRKILRIVKKITLILIDMEIIDRDSNLLVLRRAQKYRHQNRSKVKKIFTN